MIAIVDSGSTKADWFLVGDRAPDEKISTTGFNPFYQDSDYIYRSLQNQFAEAAWRKYIQKIHYYGAGCSDHTRCEIISVALQQVFPKAQVYVYHDLLAAARATCGNKEGIACILGTGSNSCLYDGNEIVDHVSNLGYLLGDEGSGGDLGKRLIRSYFYRELPDEIKRDFEKRFSLDKRSLLNTIYMNKKPNVYLASFARFLSDHKEHFYIQNMVSNAFGEFLDRHIRKYNNHNSLPIHFVGSVAYHFKDILRITLNERNLRPGIIIKKPIHNLTNYHLLGSRFVPSE